MNIACIGSREINNNETYFLRSIGARIVLDGDNIISGNAIGSDGAFAFGGSAINPTRVFLMLPWDTYNESQIIRGNIHRSVYPEEMEKAAIFYDEIYGDGRWEHLKQGTKKLMGRNYSIVSNADLVVAYPRWDGPEFVGGTATGIKMAYMLGIPVEIINPIKEYYYDYCRQCCQPQNNAHRSCTNYNYHNLKAYA